MIVAYFYDVESGRMDLDQRGHGTAHEEFDISVPRDGGIADLMEEAKRGDRRFVAVVCESVDRLARVTYFGAKIEYELEQVGVALLAADEGITADAVPPVLDVDLAGLPEDLQRQLFDAFHLQIRYHSPPTGPP